MGTNIIKIYSKQSVKLIILTSLAAVGCAVDPFQMVANATVAALEVTPQPRATASSANGRTGLRSARPDADPLVPHDEARQPFLDSCGDDRYQELEGLAVGDDGFESGLGTCAAPLEL